MGAPVRCRSRWRAVLLRCPARQRMSGAAPPPHSKAHLGGFSRCRHPLGGGGLRGRGIRLRRPRLDRVGGAAAGAGAAAEALLVVVDDGAVDGDALRYLDGAVRLVTHEPAQRRAELAAAAAVRRVQQLVDVEEVAALGGAAGAVPGAGAAADAELFVADDLAADAAVLCREPPGTRLRISRPRWVSGIRQPPSSRPRSSEALARTRRRLPGRRAGLRTGAVAAGRR